MKRRGTMIFADAIGEKGEKDVDHRVFGIYAMSPLSFDYFLLPSLIRLRDCSLQSSLLHCHTASFPSVIPLLVLDLQPCSSVSPASPLIFHLLSPLSSPIVASTDQSLFSAVPLLVYFFAITPFAFAQVGTVPLSEPCTADIECSPNEFTGEPVGCGVDMRCGGKARAVHLWQQLWLHRYLLVS